MCGRAANRAITQLFPRNTANILTEYISLTEVTTHAVLCNNFIEEILDDKTYFLQVQKYLSCF